MLRYLGLFIGGVVLFYSEIYVWSRFLNKKIDYKNFLFYLSIVFLTILSIFNSIYVNAFVRILTISILMCFCNWLIFKKKLNETIISVIYGQFICTFADVLFTLGVVILFGKDAVYVKENFFRTFIANVVISLIYVLICSIPFVKNIYYKLVEFTDKIKTKGFIMICLLIVASINFLTAIIYYDAKSIYVIVINTFLLFIYSYIVYRAMTQKNINVMIKAQNDSLMENLHQYEDMVDRQRVNNHENKNQLLIIKNMIKKKDKDVIKYIETIVRDEKEDDEALYTRVKNIPSGGLQGIIYQKMLSMKDNKIKFSLDVSYDVRKINLDNLSMDDNYKLCKIIGVFLDNAIEESLKIDDKRIMISLYVDDDMLIIDVSNRFSGEIDLNKIDEKGYTTKGDDHGYGLSLVKKIVSESDVFVNERKINKDVFKQIIKVKLK